MNQFVMLGCLWLGACATAFSQQTSEVNYQLEPMPSVRKPLPENSVPMGDSQTFEEVKHCCPEKFYHSVSCLGPLPSGTLAVRSV